MGLAAGFWPACAHHVRQLMTAFIKGNVLLPVTIIDLHVKRGVYPDMVIPICLQDNWDSAVELFQELKANRLGVRPNSVTYNILMSACLARDKPQTVSVTGCLNMLGESWVLLQHTRRPHSFILLTRLLHHPVHWYMCCR
jgi:hypothetical protein